MEAYQDAGCRLSLRRVVSLGLVLLALLVFTAVAAFADWGPQDQNARKVNRVYSYRGWQSTGIQLAQGDWFSIRAEGTWLYSPYAGPNGPEGHRRYQSPSFYPLPGVGGGALIGRVGEEGGAFYVGRSYASLADHNGLLYLRIDDDLLGDNKGDLTFDVTVVKPTPTPQR